MFYTISDKILVLTSFTTIQIKCDRLVCVFTSMTICFECMHIFNQSRHKVDVCLHSLFVNNACVASSELIAVIHTTVCVLAHTLYCSNTSAHTQQITYGHLHWKRETGKTHSPIKPSTTTHHCTHTHMQCLALPFLPSFYSTAPLMSFLTWHQCFFSLLIVCCMLRRSEHHVLLTRPSRRPVWMIMFGGAHICVDPCVCVCVHCS